MNGREPITEQIVFYEVGPGRLAVLIVDGNDYDIVREGVN